MFSGAEAGSNSRGLKGRLQFVVLRFPRRTQKVAVGGRCPLERRVSGRGAYDTGATSLLPVPAKRPNSAQKNPGFGQRSRGDGVTVTRPSDMPVFFLTFSNLLHARPQIKTQRTVEKLGFVMR